jgi:hypothetical protein
MTDRALIWEPAAGIDSPRAAIAFRYDPPDKPKCRDSRWANWVFPLLKVEARWVPVEESLER